MDEPTSSLSSTEVNMLFDIIEELKKDGMAIVYISHHLHEVFKVSDRVTVLRDGKKISTCDISEVTKEQLVEMMVGQKVTDFYKQHAYQDKGKILEVSNLTRYGFIHEVSFQLSKGDRITSYNVCYTKLLRYTNCCFSLSILAIQEPTF